jgi:acetyl-CoA carboxylase biotin carboxyl carrier protein
VTDQPAQLADAHLTALCAAVTRLLSTAADPPIRLRVTLDGAAVELEWRGERGAPAGSAVQPAQEPAEKPADEPAEFHVCAPMVGTFYHAPQPGADPFVRVGDLVSPGQQVGVLEAMKLFTPVEADRAGRVAAILVPDVTGVEYGQRLIALVDPDRP